MYPFMNDEFFTLSLYLLFIINVATLSLFYIYNIIVGVVQLINRTYSSSISGTGLF